MAVQLRRLSSGFNEVAMRSDWTTSATWASFRATGYVDNGDSGEEFYDAGGLAIVKGATPLLANATGTLVTSYVPNTTGDQHMSWHLTFTPVLGAPPSSGAVRYDVTNSSAGFMGSVTTVLPASATTSLVNVFTSNKVYRLEVRPSTQATDLRWLTVFDTSASTGAVALAAALSSSTNLKGTWLGAATGNSAVLFGAGPAGTNARTVRFT